MRSPERIAEVDLLKGLLSGLGALLSGLAKCWFLLALSVATSVLLVRADQGVESVMAAATTEGPSSIFLLLGSVVLSLLTFLLSSLVLNEWRADRKDRLTALTRYTCPLLVALLAAWAMPILLLRQKALTVVELTVLRPFAVRSLAGTLLTVVVGRFVLTHAPLRRVVPSVVLQLSGALLPRRSKKSPSQADERERSPSVIDRAVVRIVPLTIDILLYPITLSIWVLSLLPLTRRMAHVTSIAREARQRREFKVHFREVAGSAGLVVWTAFSAGLFWRLGHPTLFVLLVILGAVLNDWFFVSDVAEDLTTKVRSGRLAKLILVLMTLFIAMAGTLHLRPVALALIPIGTPFTLVVAVGFWTSLWTLARAFAAYGAAERNLVAIVGGLSVLLFLTGPYNQADIRRLSHSDEDSSRRSSLAEHIHLWLSSRREDILATSAIGGRYPVLFAVAEGGGMRAAYWTAGLLAAMHDFSPVITRHMFGMSGISGGSVGTGVFAGLLAIPPGTYTRCSPNGVGYLRPCAARILSADLLAAQIPPLLLGDGLRSVLQSPLLPSFMRFRGPHDRTTTLEEALEAEFHEATGYDILGLPWSSLWNRTSLWNGMDPPPLVIPSMTEVVSGRRAVIAPVLGAAGTWSDAVDLGARLDERTIRASTAILLSARFPGISTTGRFSDSRGVLRVVDGGYVDNSGAATAGDLLRAFEETAAAEGLAGKALPVVLFLTNSDAQDHAPTETTLGSSVAGSFVDPATTLLGVREVIATVFRKNLTSQVLAMRGEALEFRLAHGKDRFPLSWTLAPATRKILDARIDDLIPQSDSFRRLAELLAAVVYAPAPDAADGSSERRW